MAALLDGSPVEELVEHALQRFRGIQWQTLEENAGTVRGRLEGWCPHHDGGVGLESEKFPGGTRGVARSDFCVKVASGGPAGVSVSVACVQPAFSLRSACVQRAFSVRSACVQPAFSAIPPIAGRRVIGWSAVFVSVSSMRQLLLCA